MSNPHCTVGTPSPTTGTAPTPVVALPVLVRPPRGPFDHQDAEPSRVCGNCLGDFWPSDAAFEGVALVPGLCADCSAAYQRGRWQ